MEHSERKIDLLNQAIEINNDRVAGYQKAIELISNEQVGELQSLFNQYKMQSEQFISEIQPFLANVGAPMEEGTKVSGKIFRMWMDVKSLVSPSTDQAVLESCEKGEDEFKSTYNNILEKAMVDCPEIADLLRAQLVQHESAHAHIKELRDR